MGNFAHVSAALSHLWPFVADVRTREAEHRVHLFFKETNQTNPLGNFAHVSAALSHLWPFVADVRTREAEHRVHLFFKETNQTNPLRGPESSSHVSHGFTPPLPP
jgi:hypothetical protein